MRVNWLSGTVLMVTASWCLAQRADNPVNTQNSTNTYTNKTFDTAGSGNSLLINGLAVTDNTGTGVVVRATSPTLVTPALGAATATSINKVAFTAPGTAATLTVANNKTLTVSNTLTLTGTDSSSVAFGAGGTVAYATAVASAQSCGTTSSCSHTAATSPQIVFGSAPLVSGSPSTVTITGIAPAFSSSSTYVCAIASQSAAATALLSVANVSGSSFTITGPNTVSTVINYICSGS